MKKRKNPKSRNILQSKSSEYNKEYLMLEIANLELDSKIGKDRHFIAADRKDNYRIILGIISVIGTAIIASQAIKDTFSTFGFTERYHPLIVSIISLIVSICTSILGFLGLERQVAQHRFIGNMYIDIAKKAENLFYRLAELERDNDTKINKINHKFRKLQNLYLKINKEGESCPTSKKDSERSFKQNDEFHQKVKNSIKNKKLELLQIPVANEIGERVNNTIFTKQKIKCSSFCGISILAATIAAALLGIISLALLPTPFIHQPVLRWLNPLLTPLLIAALFSLLRHWQSRHGKPRGQLTFFACAWLFAFSFAAARMFMQV